MWRCEAVGRNEGIGVDSPEEKLGFEDIAGNGVGGVVELEERTMSGDCGTEGCRVVVVEDCRAGGELNNDGKSHMQLLLDTIVDARRMSYSNVLPSLSSQIVEKVAQIDHSVKGRASLPADFCKSDNHKKVRFDNDNQHNNNDDEHCGGSICNKGVGVGLCCSDVDVRDLMSVSTLKSNTTTTTMNNDNDDEEKDKHTAR